jgi:kumamolisin
MASSKVVLPGSERQPVGTRVGSQPDNERIEVSIILKPRHRTAIPRTPRARISREEFALKHGPEASAIDEVKKFAQDNNLTVGEISIPRRAVKLEGTAADMVRAFEVSLDRYEYQGHEYRARSGGIKLPAELANSVEAVLGLDNRVQAKTHFRTRGPVGKRAVLPVCSAPRRVPAGQLCVTAQSPQVHKELVALTGIEPVFKP